MTDVEIDTSHVRSWLIRPVALLVGARAVNQLGAFSLPFLAVLLVQRYDVSVAVAGATVSVFGLATIPSRLLGGWVTARRGARTTMVLGLVVCGTAQLGIAVAPGVDTVLVAVALLGLAYEVYEPASQSLIADLTEPRHRSRAFGLFGAALAAGGVLGGLLGTVLGDVDLRLLFVADAASCLTCAAIVRIGLPDHRPPEPRRDGRRARPWRDRRLLLMLGSGTGFAVLYLQLRIALPLTLVDRGVPGARFGLVLAVSSLVVVLAQPLLGVAAARHLGDPFRAMAVGYVVLAVGLAATGLVTSLTGFLVVTVVWAVGDVLLLGHPFAVVAALAPPGASAAYLATYGCCWGAAGVLAPLLGTTVLDLAGPTGLWLGCGVVALLLAAAQPALRRRVTPGGG